MAGTGWARVEARAMSSMGRAGLMAPLPPRTVGASNSGHRPALGTPHYGSRLSDRSRTHGRSTRSSAVALVNRSSPLLPAPPGAHRGAGRASGRPPHLCRSNLVSAKQYTHKLVLAWHPRAGEREGDAGEVLRVR